jgi:hypothetical protein
MQRNSELPSVLGCGLKSLQPAPGVRRRVGAVPFFFRRTRIANGGRFEVIPRRKQLHLASARGGHHVFRRASSAAGRQSASGHRAIHTRAGRRAAHRRPDNCLTNYFHRRNVDLYRLIATDEALALAIEGELELRGIDKQGRNSLFTQIIQWYARSIAFLRTIGQKWWGKPADKQADTLHTEQARYSHIALVSEWDTLYGRELPDTIERCLGENGTCRRGELDQSQRKEWLHTFKYMRGLDGQMPSADGPSSGNGAKGFANKSDKDVKSTAKGAPATKPQDRAEGQSQFDYLRRLGDRIQQLDSELRRKNKDGIAAVGVLGSDLYDKLLVLQALRPLLPNALFFTTDLDALLLHPTAQTVTRNLIVASSFGLQLRPDIQGEIPPFRNSYQTADFLATRVAIHSDDPPAPCWLRRPPLVFEIGSSREFQFATRGKPPEGKAQQEGHDDCTKHPAGAAEGERDDHAACKNDLRHCDEIQPIASAMIPPISKRLSLGLVLFGSCVALGFRSVRRRIWKSLESLMNDSKGYVWVSTCAAATVAVLGLIVFDLTGILHESWPILANRLTEDGQPLSALEGISVWPTVFLRIAILAVCIGFIVHSWKLLNRNMDRIAKDMYLVKTRDEVRAEQANTVRNSPPWIALERCVGYLPPEDDDDNESVNRRSSKTVFRFWRMYEYRGRLTARMYRVAVAVLAMLLLWGTLFLIFDHPRAPTRGDISTDQSRSYLCPPRCFWCSSLPIRRSSRIGSSRRFVRRVPFGRSRPSRNMAIDSGLSIWTVISVDLRIAVSTNTSTLSSSPSGRSASPISCTIRS